MAVWDNGHSSQRLNERNELVEAKPFDRQSARKNDSLVEKIHLLSRYAPSRVKHADMITDVKGRGPKSLRILRNITGRAHFEARCGTTEAGDSINFLRAGLYREPNMHECYDSLKNRILYS